MKKLSRLSTILIVFTSVLFSVSLVESGWADVPEVRNVVVWNDGELTKLNVTVYHSQEISSHYIDSLTVTATGGMNLSQTFSQSPHTLNPTTLTFEVTLSIGVVENMPLATVRAHCNLHGTSSQNWTGAVPEFQFGALLLAFVLATSALLVRAKTRSRPNK